MRYIYLILLGLPVFLGAGCTTTKGKTSTGDVGRATYDQSWVLKFSRGACFGQCPVFDFYLLEDHSGLVQSRGYWLDAGWYRSSLDQEALDEMLTMLEPQSLWSLGDDTGPEIADLPSMEIAYRHPDGWREYTANSRTPDQWLDLFSRIYTLVNEQHWEPLDVETAVEPAPGNTDVIVRLDENTDIVKWLAKYQRYGIMMKRRLSPSMPLYVFSRDPKRGDADDFFRDLQSDPQVIQVQWDRPVVRRGEGRE